jgi:hypothetical protein
MDMLTHCRAMASFCRQHARFEDEDPAFWTAEADEWDVLISEQQPIPPKSSDVLAKSTVSAQRQKSLNRRGASSV